MITYNQSIKILNKSIIKIEDETIKIEKCLNRITVNTIKSKVNNPSGDNAAFDGFVISSNDTKNLSKKNNKLFRILGTVAAGDKPKNNRIKKFQTFEIMTGGLIPKGFDTIIPIEQAILYPNKKSPKYILVDKKINKYQYVRFKGSDYKKDDLLIKKGTILQPNHILALKTLGIKELKVKKKPNILFFSTGNEISDQVNIPYWKVRNSNSHYLKSIDRNFFFNFFYGGILRDNDERIFEKKI